MVKALDSQSRDRGFESRCMLSLLYLESLSKICTRNVLRFTQRNENVAIHRESYCTLITCGVVACIRVVCSVEELRRCWCIQVCRGNMFNAFDNYAVVNSAISSNKLLLLCILLHRHIQCSKPAMLVHINSFRGK